TRQKAPSDNTGWTAWASLGGHCASTPDLVLNGRKELEVLCTTAGGDLAVDRKAGGKWTGWHTLAGRPGRLTGTPSAVLAGGQVGVFADQSDGQLSYAVQEGTGPAGWTGWTGLGAHLLGSPTAWTNTSGDPEAAILTGRRSIAVSTFTSGSWSPWLPLGGGY